MSKDFIIYDKASGEIFTMGTAPDPTVYPLKDGQAMIVGRLADRKTQRVSADGRIIKKRAAIIQGADLAEAWRIVRNQRASLLQASDWTQFPDTPVDAEAWREYRQALRDITDQTEDPAAIVWPQPPT
ncbi:MAG: tail fiber assembly protein [Sulfitobacter sp.]|uniref:tail fiber assembly protein n=1 Tax=Alphaproteobacteria TaxID=28211 RepID=UPI003263E82E